MAKCAATTAKGKPCKARALEGTEFCTSHLGVVGRKSVFTDEVADRILQMLRAGNYVDVACSAAGVGRSTFYDWQERGDPEGTDPADQPFREFRERVDKARAEGEARNVALVAKAATRSWQAAAWLLERQYPDRWGRPSMRQEKPDGNSDNDDAKGSPEDPFAFADELAERRRVRQG